MAASNDTVKDTFFHPEHLLIRRQSQVQGGLAFYFCNACGLLGTGIRYRCDQCDFDIHEACLTGLPRFISMAQIQGQDIGATLTRLDASRPCQGCNETSPAGGFMYCLEMPPGSGVDDVYMHPRCVLLLTVKQDFHPQHLLSVYAYDDDALTSSSPCAVCERVCTGFQYRCGECGDFNIHSGCLSLPRSISHAMHSSEHDLTLTRLKGRRWCDVCKETSNAGCYMYLCMPCNYDVHPRCVASLAALVDDGATRDRPAGEGAASRHGRGDRVLNGLRTVLRVVDTVSTLATAAALCTIM